MVVVDGRVEVVANREAGAVARDGVAGVRVLAVAFAREEVPALAVVAVVAGRRVADAEFSSVDRRDVAVVPAGAGFAVEDVVVVLFPAALVVPGLLESSTELTEARERCVGVEVVVVVGLFAVLDASGLVGGLLKLDPVDDFVVVAGDGLADVAEVPPTLRLAAVAVVVGGRFRAPAVLEVAVASGVSGAAATAAPVPAASVVG